MKEDYLTIDLYHDKPIFIICDKCKYFNDKKNICEAFPKGIPNNILTGNNSHFKKIDGQDNDIVFKQKI